MTNMDSGEAARGGFRMGYGNGSEIGPVTLEWKGDPLPEWLRTRYLKNGPGLFSAGEEQYKHWFDGLALLKDFTLSNGTVEFRSRFLDSKDYRRSTRESRVAYTEFATAPQRSILQRLLCTVNPNAQFGENASVNLQAVDGGMIAIGDLPGGLNIDSTDLRTLGRFKNDSPFIMTSTPHPQRDELRRSWINCGIGLSWRGFGYHVFKMPDRAHRPQPIAFIPRSSPAYMHSVGMSGRYVVVTEHPMFASMMRFFTLGLRSKPIVDAFRFKKDKPTTFFVVDKVSGEIAARVEAPACFYFHAVNVFDAGDEVVIDLCTYPDDGVINHLYLDYINGPDGGKTDVATLLRHRINVKQQTLITEQLTDYSIEFPVTNPWQDNIAYRYAYAVSVKPDVSDDHSNWLVKLDTHTGQVKGWFEPGCYPNEPFMIPRPGARADDDGVVLCVVLDARVQRSMLLVLDAQSFTEIGRATVPGIIPFGLHGQLMPAAR